MTHRFWRLFLNFRSTIGIFVQLWATVELFCESRAISLAVLNFPKDYDICKKQFVTLLMYILQSFHSESNIEFTIQFSKNQVQSSFEQNCYIHQQPSRVLWASVIAAKTQTHYSPGAITSCQTRKKNTLRVRRQILSIVLDIDAKLPLKSQVYSVRRE